MKTLHLIPIYIFMGILGSLVLTSGLMLNICVCGMLIFKLRPKSTAAKSKHHNPESLARTKKVPTLTVQKQITILFSNVNFILLLFTNAMLYFGMAIAYTYLKAYAEQQGMSSSLGNTMMSVLGLCSLLGRLGLGAASQHPRMNIIVLFIVAILISGN